jgi:hypothetical protein
MACERLRGAAGNMVDMSTVRDPERRVLGLLRETGVVTGIVLVRLWR